MKWETVKLGDVTEYITDGDHQPAPKADSGVHFIKIKDIDSNSISFDANMFVPKEYFDKLPKNRKPVLNDVLYTVVGSYGIPAFVRSDESFCFERNIALLHPNERVHPLFLFYCLKNPTFYKKVENVANGSAQKLIPLSKLSNLEIVIPPIKEQERIVGFLSAYDALIENNQKQIKLLEEAAQRLYKEWFIDLRFPGYENTPIVDGVPEGWERKTVGDLCSLCKDVIAPDRLLHGTPYIGLEHIPRKDFCLSEWGDSSEVTSQKYEFKKRDIVFGQIRPYFHKVGFAIVDGVASTDSFVMRPEEKTWGLFLMTVSSEAFVSYSYQTCKEGAKMPRADWNQMKKYPVLVAGESVQAKFESLVQDITERIRALALQSRQLIEARDRLLPKLMSGEIEG